MRILMLNHEYPPLGGGSGVATRHLAEALARLGHEVSVLAPGDRDEKTEEAGVEVRRFAVAMRAGRLAGVRTWLSFLRRGGGALRSACADVRPGVIHSHFLFPSGFVARRAARRIPLVASTVGAEVHDPSRAFAADRNVVMRACIGRVLRRARAVTTSARDLTARLEALYPDLHETVPVAEVPWPVPPLLPPMPGPSPAARLRRELDLPDDRFVVTSLCRLVRRKRLDVLLRAVALLGRDHVFLVVMGFGPLGEPLRALARELGIEGAVRFTGQVSEDHKAAYLQASDAFCLPSDHEGFGLAYVEAMSLGVPVVTTDVGGQTDIVRDGVEGFLVPRDDPEAVADRLERLRADAGLRQRMSEAASDRAATFAPEPVARRFVEVYERAVG